MGTSRYRQLTDELVNNKLSQHDFFNPTDALTYEMSQLRECTFAPKI